MCSVHAGEAVSRSVLVVRRGVLHHQDNRRGICVTWVWTRQKKIKVSTHLVSFQNLAGKNVRIAGTNLAPDMLAAAAFRGVGSKDRITAVTRPSHSLADGLADEILAACSRGNCELGFPLFRLHGFRLLGDDGLERRPCLLLLVLGFRGRVSRALLATDVLAVHADLVGAKGRLAAVAGTADSHADALGDTLDGDIADGLPLSRFQRQSILGEQNTSLFLLDRSPIGQHGRFGGFGGSGFGGLRFSTMLVSMLTKGSRGRAVRSSCLAGLGLSRRRSLFRGLRSSSFGRRRCRCRRSLGRRTPPQNGPHATNHLGQAVLLPLTGLRRL
jgi:hypothetical protein